MNRPAPNLCEVCGLEPAVEGVGFPASPKALPGLPDALRGGCIWVCANPVCDLAAQKRAAKAAAMAGITLKSIWRHALIRLAPDTPSERKTR